MQPARGPSGRIETVDGLRDVLYVRGDGGNCVFRITQDGLNSSGLVLDKPVNGVASVRMENATAVIEYAPQAGFRGADPFVVRILPPDNYRPKPDVRVMDVLVDVQVWG